MENKSQKQRSKHVGGLSSAVPYSHTKGNTNATGLSLGKPAKTKMGDFILSPAQLRELKGKRANAKTENILASIQKQKG